MSMGFLPGGAPVAGGDGGILGDITNFLFPQGAGSGLFGNPFSSGPNFSNVQSGSSSMSMAPYAGLPGGIAVGSPYYNNPSGQTRLANKFSPDGVHVYIQRGRPLLFSGDIAAVRRVRKVGRLCHRFFPSRYRGHTRRRYR